jgi:hypothetical protein
MSEVLKKTNVTSDVINCDTETNNPKKTCSGTNWCQRTPNSILLTSQV